MARDAVQAYFILDEMLIAGELQEPSKKVGMGHVPVAMCDGKSAIFCLLGQG